MPIRCVWTWISSKIYFSNVIDITGQCFLWTASGRINFIKSYVRPNSYLHDSYQLLLDKENTINSQHNNYLFVLREPIWVTGGLAPLVLILGTWFATVRLHVPVTWLVEEEPCESEWAPQRRGIFWERVNIPHSCRQSKHFSLDRPSCSSVADYTEVKV